MFGDKVVSLIFATDLLIRIKHPIFKFYLDNRPLIVLLYIWFTQFLRQIIISVGIASNKKAERVSRLVDVPLVSRNKQIRQRQPQPVLQHNADDAKRSAPQRVRV